MFLSDRAIRQCIVSRRIVIEPYDEEMIQPASVDLRLDQHFKYRSPSQGAIDSHNPQPMSSTDVGPKGIFILPAHSFALASTIEKVTLPADLVGRLEGKSSIGRLGVTTHVTAGFFDPGFRGHATLELFNTNDVPVWLYAGMPICQMSFAVLSSPAERPYGHEDLGSKYQEQARGPQESRNHLNFAEGS